MADGFHIRSVPPNAQVALDPQGAFDVVVERADTDFRQLWAIVAQSQPADPTGDPDVDEPNGFATLRTLAGQPNWYRGRVAVPAPPIYLGVPASGAATNWTIYVFGSKDARLEPSQPRLAGLSVVSKAIRAYTNANAWTSVGARQCMWFAWSAANAPRGLRGEVVPMHKPLRLIVPSGATKISLQADDSLWGHGNNPSSSSADGRSDVSPVIVDSGREGYQAVAYHSNNITGTAQTYNTLLGMFGDDKDTTTGSGEFQLNKWFKIGLNKTIDPLPAGAKYLFLAHHDGQEWNNNWGQVGVEIAWSA